MSRAGVTKAAVQQARDALLERGENPSIDAVRIELGNTGSKSTIHRYLRELDQPAAALGDTACLSAPLSQLVEALAGQLQDEAQAQIASAQALFTREREHLLGQLAEAERTLASARQEYAGQVAGLQARLADKAAHIDAMQAQHAQEQQRQQTQVRQLQGQLHTLQQGAIARQDEVTRLSRENGSLLAEQRQAQAMVQRLDAQLEQRDAQVQGLRAMLAQAQGAGEELRRQLSVLRTPGG